MQLDTNIQEDEKFLTTQIITYIGNKRSLLSNIEIEIKNILKEMNKEKAVCADIFSGSGIVSRIMKKYSSVLIVNDLENYSSMLNSCYLTNKEDFPQKKCNEIRKEIIELTNSNKIEGIISQNYAPKNNFDIKKGERVFYTRENALLIDSYRNYIDKNITETKLQKFFLAPLLTEASIHVNTSGVFKGFYKDKNTGIGCFGAVGKNALSRIKGTVELKEPVLSNFDSEVQIFQKDAIELSKNLQKIDIAYLDPPYNQHPYGSNYFMLNLIIKNKIDVQLSPVSGITQDWNRSPFNKSKSAYISMEKIISSIDAKYLIISYNSEGFISFEQMSSMLKKYGDLKTIEIKYNTFRGSRNLCDRAIHVSEYLFILKKNC